MYNDFFNLAISAFGNTPDPNFLFETRSSSRAFEQLTQAVVDRRGVAVLTGDAGTGKTTLLSRLLGSMPVSKLQSSVLLNPSLNAAELLEAVLIDFGVEPVPESKAQRLLLLQQLLIQGDRKGQISALIVDEAHRLTPELLEEIRLLTNIEVDDRKLLQIILAGQTELNEVLARWELRQFKQRINVRIRIEYLTPEEISNYIEYRWKKAGGKQPAPFTPQALQIIAMGSNGIPRLVNNICDNALRVAFDESRKTVTAADVRWVLTEMEMAWSEEDFDFVAEKVGHSGMDAKGVEKTPETAGRKTL